MTEKTIYNALPKLPGFNFPELHAPPSYRRQQYCVMQKGTRAVLDPRSKQSDSSKITQKGECGGLERNDILARFPEWRSLDDKVLRYFAYYMERVDESPVEKIRVRKVVIYLYLADGTIAVTETPAVVNSGLRRGTTVSRCKVDGVDFFSLYIGSVIQVRGLEYTIVDCDAATREFCATMEMPQPEPISYPDDAFEATVKVKKSPMDEEHIAMRRTMEIMAATAAGTHASLLTPEERSKARDFFEHDREVLSFSAVWEQRLFRIQYYIADQTISVMLVHARNDGRDPFSVFIRRTRIPKEARAILRDTETLNVPAGSPVVYISEDDLRTGNTVNLFTRDFYIFDCDSYTRAHYETKGIHQASFPKPPTEAEILSPSIKRPQAVHSSSKKEAPRGASTMVFEDTVAQKDRLKLTRYSNDVFRFSARYANPKPEDEGRQFVLCYYLADDTVSVYELVVANSGHVGGKCFARSAVPEIKEPGKLYVGAKVKLAGVEYELTEMDERTKRYVAMGMPLMDESFFHTRELVNRARQVVLQRFSRLTDAFRHFKSKEDGLICDDVKRLFVECGIRLDATELKNVMEDLDQDKDQIVSLAEFTEYLLGQQFVSDFVPKNEKTKDIGRGPLPTQRNLDSNKTMAKEGEEALRKLIAQSEARRVLLIRACKIVANTTYDGNLSIIDFENTIKDRLNLSFSDREMDALVYKFYYVPGVSDWRGRRLPVKEIQRLVML
ncbi:protein of unknown function DUF1126 [Trypanosoma melophagium]|uniref:protein of unknown function DUF1126 n=1 Tax=Trypanosoma melophagium TaxID=715481 RepID=UPI003519FC65|nr:protein of unknown function DUF1126 [Trypanosoma melophagium]